MNTTIDARRRKAVEDASHWHVTLQAGDVSDDQLQEWARWMEASPEHAKAFDNIALLWEAAGALPDDAALPPPPAAARERVRAPRRWPWALAAMLALTVAAHLLLPGPGDERDARTLATAIAERRELTLDDGSRLELDAATEIAVRYDARRREVVLSRGRVFFDVARDTDRPFVVQAGGTSSQVLGTRFAVGLRRDGSVAVTVGEGRVRVASAAGLQQELGRDQQVEYRPGHGLGAPRETNANLATAWRSGTVVYQSEPLDRVIDDLNRYSHLPVRLEDPSLAAVEVTGLWRLANIDAWIDGLAASLQLQVRRTPEAIVLARGRRSG